jgi:hypothetical protein
MSVFENPATPQYLMIVVTLLTAIGVPYFTIKSARKVNGRKDLEDKISARVGRDDCSNFRQRIGGEVDEARHDIRELYELSRRQNTALAFIVGQMGGDVNSLGLK